MTAIVCRNRRRRHSISHFVPRPATEVGPRVTAIRRLEASSSQSGTVNGKAVNQSNVVAVVHSDEASDAGEMESFVVSAVVVVVHSFVPSFLRSFVPSFLRSFVPSFLRSFVPSFVPLFVRSFVRSFVPSFVVAVVMANWAFGRLLPSFVTSLLRCFVHCCGCGCGCGFPPLSVCLCLCVCICLSVLVAACTTTITSAAARSCVELPDYTVELDFRLPTRNRLAARPTGVLD